MIQPRRIINPLILMAHIIACAVSSQDYRSLQTSVLKFYAYQRAGISDGTNPHNPFYTTSPYPHSNDSRNGSDLSSGWYDAGDFVKFGLPQGYTAYTLLKGYDVFPRGYSDEYGVSNTSSPDGIPDILNQVKYSTDYLIRAVMSSNSVVLDMGLASQDHQTLYESGYQNSNRVPNRTAVMADGADVPGLYSASLALMSRLYAPHDADYAVLCLQKAREAFTFGLSHTGVSTPQTKGGTAMYTAADWKDKMALAAVELYRVTNEDVYLQWALTWMPEVGSHFHVVGYGNVGDYLAFEMYRLGYNSTAAWFADINLMLSRVVTAPQASQLIQGAFISTDWGNCGNAGNGALSAALAFLVTGNNLYRDFAFNQVNWISGINPFARSFIVNYNNGPTQPHHRNDATIGGLMGAVVSGPAPQGSFDINSPESSSWVFTDSRDLFVNTEPALNYNAGIVGALGFILDYNNPPTGLIRISQGLQSAHDPLDLNDGPQTLTMTLESPGPWTLSLTGQSSGAIKNLTGSGSNISVTWSGEADAGAFIPGENVVVQLVSDNIAPYHMSRSQTAFFLLNFPKSPFTDADKLLDDFNDDDLLNTLGGTWKGFNDGGASYTSPGILTPGNSITAAGESGTGGLLVRLVGKPGAPRPHAGIRATLKADSSVFSLGSFTGLVFDIKVPAASEPLSVEFEQPDITDGAYYRSIVPLNSDAWMRVRIPLSFFAQPGWRTADIFLRRDALTAIRFTYYGEKNISFTLDNVHVTNMDPGGVALNVQMLETEQQVFINISNGQLEYYSRVSTETGPGELKIRNTKGRTFFQTRNFQAGSEGYFSINVSDLPAGWYFLEQSSLSTPDKWVRKFLIQ